LEQLRFQLIFLRLLHSIKLKNPFDVGSMNTPRIVIRPEVASDVAAITDVIDAAFLGMPYAEGDEAELVTVLRQTGALYVSLVAELENAVVGHIAFSPAHLSNKAAGWYGLGPLAVFPAYQNAGIGSALLRKGLETISGLGAHGCILVGLPQIYSRFGFVQAPNNAPSDEPKDYFMVKIFKGGVPIGPIFFHEAFKHIA
jgi:putative acetyltransferase